MIPSGTDIRRMLAKAQAKMGDVEGKTPIGAGMESAYATGVEAALAWVLGEQKDPPIS